MTQKLKDRVAIVVGSTSGIGEAIAREYATQGAKVVVTGRTKEKGEKLVKKLTDSGYDASFYQVDVTDVDQCKSLIEDTYKKYNQLDILVNNAGIAKATPLEELELEQWDATFDINIRSYFVLTKAALPYLQKSDNGSILYTSSMASIKAFDQQYAYGATKAAVSHFARMIAVGYANKGVRSNAIAPGVIDTEILANAPEEYIDSIVEGIPMKRLGKPEEIAKVAVFLASEDASYVTGQVISVCGGASIV